MKVLVLGTGGREHALAWRLAQDVGQSNVLLHPGNAGTQSAGFATLGSVSVDSAADLVGAVRRVGIDLVVIGPENLLARGLADALRSAGTPVFGPGAHAARLESSKIFAKEFMVASGIPTAPFEVLGSPEQMAERAFRFPCVFKLDGLAAGKGVVVAQARADVDTFVTLWKDARKKDPTARAFVEDCLSGVEVSYLGLCDGRRFVPLASATDYKRLNDHQQGPNTGGMGAVSPSPYFTDDLSLRLSTQIVEPILRQLAAQGLDYRGVLYIGLMITDQGAPSVLEFNARFGDPETQAILPRWKGSCVDALMKTALGQLTDLAPLAWHPLTSVYVVGTAAGYPETPRTGDPILGLSGLDSQTYCFFSGVANSAEGLVTAGGRVLGLGALAATSGLAREVVYRSWNNVHWKGRHYRRDIGT